MALGAHAAFIIAAYGLALGVIAALIAWIVMDYARQRRTLADLERRGVVRRSAGVRPAPIEGTT
jgi:heme exporter protein D